MDSDDEAELVTSKETSFEAKVREENDTESLAKAPSKTSLAIGGGIEPRRPGICKARASDGCATVWWTDGSENDDRRGSTAGSADEPLYSTTHTYVVRKYRMDGNEWKYKGEAAEIDFPATSVTVTPLTNGCKYKFTVQARTKKGIKSLESPESEVVEPFEPLPEPWTEHFDKANNQRYYFNAETNERTLIRPKDNVYAVSEENKALFQRKEIAKMRLRFSEIDEDESGKLDDGELAKLFKELDIAISRPRIRRLIRLVDSDGNGTVEFDEFLTLMHLMRNGYGETLQDQFQKLVNGNTVKNAAGAMFTKIKGRLGENAKQERIHEQRMLARIRMGDWVKKYDEVRRRDYYVNKVTLEKTYKIPDEVMWFVPEELAEVFSEEQLHDFKEQFERFDEDGSGEMDTDELTEALRTLGDELSHSAALALIKEVDVDNSGEICFAEFVQIMNIRRKQKRGLVEKITNPGKEDKAKVRSLKREVFEIKQENNALRKEVQVLKRECVDMRKKKMVFVPVVPLKEFLAEANLNQYHDAMASFGVRDTSDLFRLEEEDYLEEFGMKRGHMRKVLSMLTAMKPAKKDEAPVSP